MKQGILRACAVVFTVLFLCGSLLAQTAAYTVHTIAVGESLSSMAKEYHTTVGDIMRLNNMHSDSKLMIGDKLKIPATSSPVQPQPATPVKAKPAATVTHKEVLKHTVKSGESLYHISQTYKVPVEKLISLNHLPNTGEIKVGQVLLISDGSTPAKIKTETAPATTATQPKPANAAPPHQPTVQPKQTPPANTTYDSSAALPAPVPAQKQDNATVLPPVQEQNDAFTTTSNSNVPPAVAQPAFTSGAAAPKEGFFTAQFRQNVEGRSEQTKTGAAMTFKSASGWADKKFYILMNDAPPGAIVKVMNGNNIVYAKVLWSLGAQKENNGLDYRISTAAAAALTITDEQFDVTVTYFQ